jgi:DAK2 domain fusion protein YloV
MITYCNGRRFIKALTASSDWLSFKAEVVNNLNVFPVPDGDTGFNMSLTLRPAVSAAKQSAHKDLSSIAKEVGASSVMASRGCSGVILSQFLIGLTKSLEGKDRVEAKELAQALYQGAEAAYRAMREPVEGTILTVAREATRKGVDIAKKENDIAQIMKAVYHQAREVLEKTPNMLPVLKGAGVVDAGGMGFVYMLEGVLRLIEGKPLQKFQSASSARKVVGTWERGMKYKYCTEFLIIGQDLVLKEIEDGLVKYGDCASVIGSSVLAKCHIHTNEPDRVQKYAATLGAVDKVKVDDMDKQHRNLLNAEELGEPASVAIVTGDNHGIPDNLLEELEITMLPFPLTLEGDEYRISENITAEDFLAKIKTSKVFPKSAALNAARFAQAYKKLIDQGKSIVSITMAGGIFSQPTVDAAKKAAEEVGGRNVIVVNSMHIVHPIGLVVLEAARAAKEGKNQAEVARIAQEVASKSALLCALPNLEYLYRGGRIGKAKLLMGSLMKVIPLIIMRYGTQAIEPLGKGRNITQANEKMIETIKADMESSGAKAIKALIADSGDNPDATKALKESLQENIECKEIIIGKLRCEMVHLGPGAWGLGYYLVK